MNRYNIVIPLHRFENLNRLREMFAQPSFGHCHCTLLVATEELSEFESAADGLMFWEELWTCPNEGHGSCREGNWRIKQWLSQVAMKSDSERYICLLNDDDYYEPNFFEKLAKVISPVVMVSMLRGHNIMPDPATQHPTTPLIASGQALHFGGFGLEQVLFKPSALQKVGVNPNDEVEATLIDIARSSPMEIVSGAHVWFNYLEPGRWNI